MAVRVLIEREIEPGHELQLHQLLLQLRAKAMQVKGYISGETLRALDDPTRFLVISTWSNLDEWKSWENNSDRKRIEGQISSLLRSPEKKAIYSYI